MKRLLHLLPCFSLCLLCLLSFSHATRAQKRAAASAALRSRAFPADVHSYANPAQTAVKHIDLDWRVRFEEKMLDGTATLTLDRAATGAHPLMLDTRDLEISKVETSTDNRRFRETRWQLGARDAILGSGLTISIPRGTSYVRVAYKTSPTASGLQWLTPAQTAGKRSPFLFTQAQAIHARSFIPLQDSPGVRVTYTARVRTPEGLRAVMSAANNTQGSERAGDYRFEMRQPIPAYLIALAVGDLSFKSLGRRTGVYAEPSVVEAAARELEDTERMVEATERLVGPYRWERYDLLILPPSFPFGGMENPRLTFATPTILAGDKSLVSLVAHELAHSWSGNLVTNATWSDFWLNEGFTTYLERRIIEAVYGRARAEMEAVLGRRTLDAELATLPTPDEILRVNLKGRDPDEGFTQVPYEKGALFLRRLEEGAGRPAFDRFLRGYFDRFAFQSIVTDDFLRHLRTNLLAKNPRLAARVNLEEWIDQAGLPTDAPTAKSTAFTSIERHARDFAAGRTAAAAINTRAWTTQEWLHFLTSLPAQLTVTQMSELDRAFNLTTRGNSEIAHQWLLLAIRNDYAPAYARLDAYLTTIGRRKLIKPLYDELVKTPEGRERARQIYRRARPGYHPIAIQTIDRIVNPPSE